MIFPKNFARNYEKTNNTWNMRCLSQQPSEPAYYIEDCRISIHCALDTDLLSRRETNKKGGRSFLVHM